MSGADAQPDSIGHRQIETLEREDHRRRRQHVNTGTAADGIGSAKPRDSFIEVIPATSSRMAAESRIQGMRADESCGLRAQQALAALNSGIS